MKKKGMHVVNFDTLSRIGEGGVRLANLDLMFASEDIVDIIGYKQLDDP